jgi:DNA-binding GntR family transcriptional regulator
VELGTKLRGALDVMHVSLRVGEKKLELCDIGVGGVLRRKLGGEFHLAIAEASHNRVLVVQIISLQHVSWPRRNPTLTPKVMRRVNEVHRELLGLIEIRDAAGARKLMDDHVKMIRARRVTEDAKRTPQPLGSRSRGSEGKLRIDDGSDEIDCC